MKNKRKLTYFAFLTLIITVALTFTSCGAIFSGVLMAAIGDSVAEESEVVEIYPDASFPAEEWADKLPDEYIQNDITINGDKSDVSYAAAAGLRSAVSIYCNFGSASSDFWGESSQFYTTGSGVIYKVNAEGDAFIITNFHVVYDTESSTSNGISTDISVFLYGMEADEYAIKATYVGGSANYDIAILRVDNSAVLRNAFARGAAAPVKIANSDLVFPGEASIAIGNPSSDDIRGLSVTTGIVSVDSEYITMTAADESGLVSFRVIRTDTPVNSGNSGGGLYNEKGELIGIVNAKSALTEIENIGYAIPSNVVRAIADNIIDYCYGTANENVMRGMLGVSVNVVGYTTEYDTASGMLIRHESIAIASVEKGKLADGMLQVGDVVKTLKIGDGNEAKETEVYRMHHLIDSMLDVRIGDTVYMTVIRNDKEITVSTTITSECLEKY